MSKVVSIVSYKFLPAKVGGQKGIALFNKYFSRHQQLICVTTKNNAVAEAEGYEVLPLLSTSPLRYINLFYFFTIRKLIRDYKATHLLIEHPYYGWLAFLLKKFCRIKLIVHSHNIEGIRWKSLGKWWWKILWRYEKFFHRHADFSFFIHQQDLDYAVREFRLDPSKCLVMTYGIERSSPPSNDEKLAAKNQIVRLHKIEPQEKILLFNGAFDYKPNIEALNTLLNHINPLLSSSQGFEYKLVICGRSIPADITKRLFPNVIIAGFVNDIDIYFKAADVFLNPIMEGGGIKTKLVEALGFNCNAVSTVNGALGVDPAICNGKLLIVPDKDWLMFSQKVVEAVSIRAEIKSAYYEHFYWGYSTSKAAAFIETKSLSKEA